MVRFSTRTGVVAVLSLMVSSPAFPADTSTQAEQLLNLFSSDCPSQREWTASALATAQNLVTVVRALRDDEDCRSFAGVNAQLDLLQTQLQGVQMNENDRKLAGLRREEQERLLQLGAAETSEDRALQRREILRVQAEIATYEGYGREEQNSSDLRRQGETLNQMVSSIDLLARQAMANTRCMERNPSILADIASLSGSVSAVALTGGASLGVAGVTRLLGNWVESARERRLQVRIYQLARPIVQKAYSCVLESLSNRWCAADDALRIVRLKAEVLERAQNRTPLDEGVEIIDDDLPLLLGWLEKVRSGAPASNRSSADRQSAVINREAEVAQAKILSSAIISENRTLFAQIPDDANSPAGKIESQWTRLRLTINSLMQVFNPCMGSMQCSVNSPLADVISDPGFAPFFLLGFTSIPREPTGDQAAYNFANFPALVNGAWNSAYFSVPPTMAIIEAKAADWIRRAQLAVNIERATTLQPDAIQVVYDATMELNGVSPYGALQSIREFLVRQTPRSFAIGGHRRLYQDTIRRLLAIEAAIRPVVEDPPGPNPLPTGSPDVALSLIYNEAALDAGTVLLSGRIERAVKLALNEYLLNPANGYDAATSGLLLAADDVLAELGRYSVSSGLNQLDADLVSAQGVLQDTVKGFTQVFGDGIGKTMRELSAEGVLGPVPDGAADRRELARMCFFLLSSPTWPSQVPLTLCAGQKLSSIYRSGPVPPTFDPILVNLPLRDRACRHRGFDRSIRLYEKKLERDRSSRIR